MLFGHGSHKAKCGRQLKAYAKWIKILSKYFLFCILMDPSILQYHVKITSVEDWTMECAIFLVKINLYNETPAISHQNCLKMSFYRFSYHY